MARLRVVVILALVAYASARAGFKSERKGWLDSIASRTLRSIADVISAKYGTLFSGSFSGGAAGCDIRLKKVCDENSCEACTYDCKQSLDQSLNPYNSDFMSCLYLENCIEANCPEKLFLSSGVGIRPSSTPSPSSTLSPSASFTPFFSLSPWVSNSPSSSSSPSSSITPSFTSSPSASITPFFTSSPSSSISPSSSPSPSAFITPSSSSSPSAFITPSSTSIPSASITLVLN